MINLFGGGVDYAHQNMLCHVHFMHLNVDALAEKNELPLLLFSMVMAGNKLNETLNFNESLCVKRRRIN